MKWGKESYDIDSGATFDELQALLFSLTFVPVERQKIMSKGKMIKDNAAVAALKDGDKLVLMGTADPPPKEPEKKTVFVEDMSDAQKIAVVKDMLSAGLHNLGNTSEHKEQHSVARSDREREELESAESERARAPHRQQEQRDLLGVAVCSCSLNSQLLHGFHASVHARRARTQASAHQVSAQPSTLCTHGLDASLLVAERSLHRCCLASALLPSLSKSNGVQPQHHDPNAAVVKQLGALYRQMDQTTNAVTPMMFTTVFRSTFPQFAETNHEGNWMQQDAEEAMIQLMNAMANVLKTTGSGSATGSTNLENNTIDEYFGFKVETTTKLKGADDSSSSSSSSSAAAATSAASSLSVDQPKLEVETQRRLKCFIDVETNFLFQGLKRGLVEERELRGLLYERTSVMLTLPRYLIVQMMRFGWRNDTKKKSKILRKVDFPFKLDMIDFVAPTLKHQLMQARNLLKEEQDAALGLKSLTKKAKTAENQTAGSSAAASSSSAAAPAAAAATDAMTDVAPSASASPEAPASTLKLTTPTSGLYEVFAVVTHKGRTSDSGHYVSWTKQANGEWFKFDDDVVTRTTEDQIKALSGGGDHDSAYLIFYRRIDDVTKFAGQSIPEPTVVTAPAFDAKKHAAEAKEKAAAAAGAGASK